MVLGILLILLVVGPALSVAWNRRQRTQLLRNVRSTWGLRRTTPSPAELDQIALYHQFVSLNSVNVLDEKTCKDLNLDDIFGYVDRTSSKVGQQFLFHLLRTPQSEKKSLLKFEQVINCFANVQLREKLQIELYRLNLKDALFLPYLFLAELPRRLSFQFVFPLLTLATVTLAIAAFFNPRLLSVAIPLTLVNMLLGGFYRSKLQGYIQPLRLLNVLINTAVRVSQYNEAELSDQIQQLKDCVKNLSGLKRRTAWLGFESGYDEVSSLIYGYLNMLFLLDVNCFVFSLEELRKKRNEVAAVYEALGYLDAAISVASVRTGNTNWTKPVFIARHKACRFQELYHPLLEAPVPNDLTVRGKGILLTGSNMSGKSTFIRTVGVNAVLAQTIHSCFAKAYQSPFFRIRASMGGGDSLLEGKSFYMDEVQTILGLVNSTQSPRQNLFLIDELFRGTNTIERIAAAKAILEHLNQDDNIVLVATHDIELVELLGHQYESYHFRELIYGEQMSFDYRLQQGTSSTRNAIAILELFGYPKPIVAEALQVVDQLEQKKSVTLLRWLEGLTGIR